MRAWPAFRDSPEADALYDTPDERMYWTGAFDGMHDGRISTTWDYAWWFACMTQGLSIHPVVNLVSNIGIGPAATHTASHHALAFRETRPLDSPLIHPPWVVRDKRADVDTFDWRFPGAVLREQRTLAHHVRRPFRWLSRRLRME